MYSFGVKSQAQLDTCHPKLQEILNEAIKHIDFSVICGERTKAEQDRAYRSGMSSVQYPNSKHNTRPSLGVDVAPYPIRWDDTERFAHLVGIIKGIAIAKGINVRLGIDWDNDGDIRDHSFMDYPHIELVQ